MIVRSILLFLCLVPFASAFSAEALPHPDAGEWNRFKTHFVSGDGRVIDRFQNEMSHSEGQGYALFLAVRFNDKQTFDKLLRWTNNNLQVRKDALNAWGWGKRPNDEWNVMDYNNATDGDVMIAYALLRADQSWRQKAYTQQAQAIIQSLRKHLAVKNGEHSFLLPGYHGFTSNKGLVLNPSYLILSAYQAFAGIDERAFWEKIRSDAEYLLTESCRNTANLPADWLLIDSAGNIKIDPDKSTRFSYEAIRVLLYSAWAKRPQPAGVQSLLDYYQQNGRLPAWQDLIRQEVAEETASAGFYRVFALAADQIGNPKLAERLRQEARQRLENEQNDYYSNVLYLLAGE